MERLNEPTPMYVSKLIRLGILKALKIANDMQYTHRVQITREAILSMAIQSSKFCNNMSKELRTNIIDGFAYLKQYSDILSKQLNASVKYIETADPISKKKSAIIEVIYSFSESEKLLISASKTYANTNIGNRIKPLIEKYKIYIADTEQ
jgi:hypothetical protein